MNAYTAPLLPAATNSTATRRSSSLASRWRRLKKLLLAAVAGAFVLVVTTILAFTLIDNAALAGYDATFFLPNSAASGGDAVQQEESPVSRVYRQEADGSRDLLRPCDEKFITQDLDHFRATRDDEAGDIDSNGGGSTFEQRYFICAKERFNAKNGSIFFYFGAEADVELYLNHTGLMWENAEAFSALVVFVEHRYFGKSVPFDGDEVLSHMQYLSSTQALADYAVLIETIKHEELSIVDEVPLIGFGGNYGGMLAAWFRLKYPHLIDGVIAASAPVLGFLGDEKHPVDWEGFMRIVTYDMSETAGSAPNCIKNARRAYDTFLAIGESASGRRELARIFRLCDQSMLVTDDDVQQVAYESLEVFGSLAMGNYPYPSSYMTGGASVLPAYPMRAACEFLSPEFGGEHEGDDDYESLLSAFRESAAVLFNSSKQEQCLFPKPTNTSADVPNFFDYIACSELYMPMGSDGIHDVFPAVSVDPIRDDARCFKQWGVRLRPEWGMTEYGGVRALRKTSNIVFSNGDFDPWSATGVLKNLTDSVVFVPIESGAHHVDLFFSHPLDPLTLTQAREIEKQHMRKWVDEFYALK